MLKRVIVKNFKCFKNETIFDFRKTNYRFLEENTKGKVLKGALFVGDNASGKTTAIQPMKLLLDLLLKDKEMNLFIFHCFFSKDKSTHMKYEFEIDNYEIEYAFAFSGNDFIEETLKIDKESVIERIGKEAKMTLNGETSFHKIDSSLLFLKKLYFSTKFEGNHLLLHWYDFLKNSVYINAYSREIVTYNGESLVMGKYFEKYGEQEINDFFVKNNFPYTIQYAKEVEKGGIHYRMEENEGKMVFFERQDIVALPIIFESTGNQTLVNILPAILHSLKNSGMLIIDEFSSGFHNKLEELIVRYFMKKSIDTQLFFVSHSTNLLSNALFRPDQIYAVEMEGKEGSKVLRFSEEQPRVAQNLEKMYLSGVFGGIPEYGTYKE